jgi:hypothetical protein
MSECLLEIVEARPSLVGHPPLGQPAADLVEMTIEGSEPSDLSLRRLMKGFPITWDEHWAESGGGAAAAVPGIRNASTKQVQTLAAEFQTPVG